MLGKESSVHPSVFGLGLVIFVVKRGDLNEIGGVAYKTASTEEDRVEKRLEGVSFGASSEFRMKSGLSRS